MDTHRKPHLFFSHIHTFIYPGRMFSVYQKLPFIPTVLDGLSCTGNEATLLDCCHIGGLHNCFSNIFIECAGMCMWINRGSSQYIAIQKFPDSLQFF